ncbi:hypothetical protein PHAVU_003G164600 [Phaseolus vulgaris]|uniref:Peroxidase n=1 Tax=Phaseolus vulgaris TaxID=3885 RepID=V7CDM8_PHAVU|nr:hypothetical protein PHAVU_003G164600g [Phaseolus vulgaris]ESW26996.1 hypothetical protein PHAVU_003G164600g [Phaseolus vulgaris]
MDAILGSLMILVMSLAVEAELKNEFYSTSCPKAEATVRSTVESHFKKDPTIAAALLRLQFHDCFVQGCDGSILITGSSAEINAKANIGLRGFEVIDDAKSQIEAICPGIVSCADIVVFAARDAVVLNDGPGWAVAAGRRDGRISLSSETSSLPAPVDSVSVQRQKFAAKGLDDHDLVTLVGAHTIGQTDCRFFSYRLYNFTSSGQPDPSINAEFLPQLEALCPKNGDGLKKVALDKDSPAKFDVSFFKNVRDGYGVLESDQRLWEDPATQTEVKNYAGTFRGLLGFRFEFEFPKAMNKLSSIEVKTGTAGEIRKVCSKFNS